MVNPIIRKEVKTSVRSFKLFAMITAYVSVMLIISVLFLTGMGSSNTFDPRSSIYLYCILSGFQMFFIMLMVPTLCGSAISGERDRQTLDLLLVTKMSSYSIVFGKLISSLFVTLILVVSSMPVYSLLMFYGGVSILNIFGIVTYTMVMAAMGGSLAIFLSTFTKKTIISMVVCYVIFLALTVGNVAVYLILQNAYNNALNESLPRLVTHFFGATNPFLSLLSVYDTQFGLGTLDSMLYSGYYSPDGLNIITAVPMWVYNTVINAVAAVVLTLLSALLINPEHRRR